ncbi:hypothetical protein LCGC14_1168660 [marine sediment metagenome]|uniref:dATP/dGTP diphosphohydrolase N-terminal domain-containing protein n=1 Tax=marine sediment metagenome TaxID=412755 RepID=A0A0F9MDG6_9ZZZZ
MNEASPMRGEEERPPLGADEAAVHAGIRAEDMHASEHDQVDHPTPRITTAISAEDRAKAMGADELPQEPTDDDRAAELHDAEMAERFGPEDPGPMPDDAKRYVAPDGTPGDPMPPNTKRYSSKTGTEGGQRADDKDKIRFDLIPPWPFFLLGQVYTIGANKYGDDNWKKGMSWMRMVGSMKRHLEAFIMGESMDPEDGQHHLASVAWGAFALMEYELFRPEFDDRPVNVLAIARALYEKAQENNPAATHPASHEFGGGDPDEPGSAIDLAAPELTYDEKETIDKARALLADKSAAAAEYLNAGIPEIDPQAPADEVEPPEDLAAELAERPNVMEQMAGDDDLTDDEKELLRRAEEVRAAEPPEVKLNRADRRRQAKEDRKKKPAPRVAPGTGPDQEGMSVGQTRFDEVRGRRRGA